MNRTNLLATGAIVALVFATGTSMAQQERGAPSPAEKMTPSGAKQPSAVKHHNDEGQNTPAGRNERPEGRIGEAPQNRGRPETTGQVPREDEQKRRNERTSEPKRGETEQGPRSERNGQIPATGHAPQEDRTNRASERNKLEQNQERTNRTEENSATTGHSAAGTRAYINLPPEKRTRIHETLIRERNAPRVSSVNFDVSVGARVSRSVRFVALPQTIVEIEPTWRSFEYFMIGDEIVIVDPRSLEIVAIVTA